MAGNICRCGTYQRIRAAIKARGEGAGMSKLSTIVTANVSRRHFLGGVFSTGAFVLAARVVPESPVGADARRSGRRPTRRRSIRASTSASSPTARSSSSRTARRWAPASGRRCRWSRPTSSTPTGSASRSSRASATRGTATRTPTARDRSATSTMRSARPAPRRARCSSRPRRRSGTCPPSECTTDLHEVVHSRAAGIGYGALVPAAAKLPVPKRATLKFKPKSAWRYVGKEQPIYDLTDIVSGKAQFGLDAQARRAWSTRRSSIRRCSAATVKSSTTRRRSPSRASGRR